MYNGKVMDDFIAAHVLYCQLAYGSNQCNIETLIDQFFDLVLKLGDFVAEAIGRKREDSDVADVLIDMIQDEKKAMKFINEHFVIKAS